MQYIAPEQIEGRETDARTDIFAFGAVVYEMVTGRKAFEGRSQASLMAAILEHEPAPLTQVAPLVPAALDSRREYAAASRGPAVLALAGLASFAIYSVRRQVPAAAPSISFSIYPPEGTKFPRGTAEMAVSPDGSGVAFVALSADSTRRLWMRRFDSVAARAIDGTEDASYPFWSPDGRSLGFFTCQPIGLSTDVFSSLKLADISGSCRSRHLRRRGRSSRRPRIRFKASSLRTCGGLPTRRTSPAARRCTFGAFPAPMASGRCRRTGARSRDGVGTGRSCSHGGAEDENSAPITVMLNWEAALKK